MSTNQNSDVVTRGIRVRAGAAYIPERSEPSRNSYFFGYRITITNEGDVPARLLSRHWVIIDADGTREDVEGEGVIGETPSLAPGESFTYTSFCPLKTHWGTMEGMYLFELPTLERFDVAIGRFYLVAQLQPNSEVSQ